MKPFDNLTLKQKLAISAVSLVVLAVVAFQDFGSSQNSDEAKDGWADTATMQTSNAGIAQDTSRSGSGTITLYDKGLQMPRGTYEIPEGWNLRQNLATDPTSGQPTVTQMEIWSDHGDLIMALPQGSYAVSMGRSFQQTWQRLAYSSLRNNFQQIRFGQPRPSPSLMNTGGVQQAARQAVQNGNRFQAMEVPISATREGAPFDGLLRFAHLTPANAPFQLGGIYLGSITLAPHGRLDQVLQTKQRIDASFVSNPTYQQRIFQITQRARVRDKAFSDQQMATATAAHNARMRDQKAMFDSSQRNIADMNRMGDQQHAQFMQQLSGSGADAGQGSGNYDGQAAAVDQIWGRQSFNNPDTGQVQSMDGQYKYNYTDGYGHFYRTNDPNFDAASLTGDWRRTDPLSPEN